MDSGSKANPEYRSDGGALPAALERGRMGFKRFFKKTLAAQVRSAMFPFHFRQKRQMAAFGATDN
jgi:hypothetical protein